MAEYIEREALREILDGWRDAHADVDDVRRRTDGRQRGPGGAWAVG